MSDGHSQSFIAPGIDMVEELTAKLIGLNIELEQKNRQLEASEKARISILSNISHDLRSPLAAVRGAVDRLLPGTVSPEEARRLTEIINLRVLALEKLVDELYFSVTLEQPEFLLKRECIPIVPFLEEYFITLEISGRFDTRRAVLNVPGDMDCLVNIDTHRFLRVLDNLVSNALRHTNEGALIEIGCSCGDGSVGIYLRDSGEGISADDLPHIFERTYTASRARTPGETGSGLGLHIARSIIEKHGGEISCVSTRGEGATFRITLPMAAEQ